MILQDGHTGVNFCKAGGCISIWGNVIQQECVIACFASQSGIDTPNWNAPKAGDFSVEMKSDFELRQETRRF
jgi:hypothetical protein